MIYYKKQIDGQKNKRDRTMLYKTLFCFFYLKNHVVKLELVITGHPVYMSLITFH